MLASAHNSRLARAVRIALGTASISMVALAAHGQAASTESDTELEAVTITGFRSSLDLALDRQAQRHRRRSTRSAPRTSSTSPT